MYDNVEEFYVVIKEKGQREEKHTQEETRRKKEKLEATMSGRHMYTLESYVLYS